MADPEQFDADPDLTGTSYINVNPVPNYISLVKLLKIN